MPRDRISNWFLMNRNIGWCFHEPVSLVWSKPNWHLKTSYNFMLSAYEWRARKGFEWALEEGWKVQIHTWTLEVCLSYYNRRLLIWCSSADKNHQYTKKEATGHSFQVIDMVNRAVQQLTLWKAERQNWGWVSFTRRDSLRDHDSLVIVCTIISFSKPVQTPRETRIAVPKSLVDTFGSLLNDLAHSDVKFILPDRRRKGQTRCIYANRKILERVDYFRTSELEVDLTILLDDFSTFSVSVWFCWRAISPNATRRRRHGRE